MDLRIGILTTLWKREALSEIVLKHYDGLEIPGVELVKIAVGSEGAASRRLAEACGWSYVEAPNAPLGAKHNAGMEAFRTEGVEGVCVVGSDDLLNGRYFEWIRGHIETGAEVVELRSLYFYDQPTGRLAFNNNWSTGAGRMFSRRFLDRCGWRPWPDAQERYLDGAVCDICRTAKPRRRINDIRTDGIMLVDIKTEGQQMWDFANSSFRSRREEITDAQGWWEATFPGVYEQLTTINTAQTDG